MTLKWWQSQTIDHYFELDVISGFTAKLLSEKNCSSNAGEINAPWRHPTNDPFGLMFESSCKMQTEKMTSQVLLNSDYDIVIKITFDEYKKRLNNHKFFFYFSYQLEVNFIGLMVQGANTQANRVGHKRCCSTSSTELLPTLPVKKTDRVCLNMFHIHA